MRPLHPLRRRYAQIESACGEMNSPCDVIYFKLTQISAGCPRGLIPRERCPLRHVPRTGVITLHRLIPRTAGFLNNITMPRSGRRLRRAPFYYLKQIARALHPTLCWVMRIGAFAFAEHMKLFLSLAQNRGFCRQGVPAALFRENALLHYQAYCADSRDVILSRRACGASKNLLRPPQSSCNATMPAFLYPPCHFDRSEE